MTRLQRQAPVSKSTSKVGLVLEGSKQIDSLNDLSNAEAAPRLPTFILRVWPLFKKTRTYLHINFSVVIVVILRPISPGNKFTALYSN